MLNRLMAHLATERTLTDEERGILTSALAIYKMECRGNARDSMKLRTESLRNAAVNDWRRREHLANNLFMMLLPEDGSHTRVTVRW